MNFDLGFKALAYPASNLSDYVSPCQCSLVFKCDDASREATILLLVTIPTAYDTQTFVLQYDADMLLSGTVNLISGNSHVPQSQLDGILRIKNDRRPQFKTLALSLQQPSPVWCPGSRSFVHKPGFESSFRQFVDLIKATTVHIVFDYKFLPKEYQSTFKAFSKAAKDLTGYPVGRFLTRQGLRKASWEVFGPVDAVGAPPAYENSRKRLRQGSTSLGQSPKRLAPQSPTESYTSDTTVPNSPATAEAISAAFLKTPVSDDRVEAINAAVGKQLPAHLEKILPSLLSDILPTLFVSPSDSDLSKPHISPESPGISPSKLPPLTPLGQLLIPHLRTHLADEFQQYQTYQLQRFQKLLDRLWDSAEGTRAHETAEMEEYMEEHKTDMTLLKNDAIKELSADIDAVFAKGREEGWDLSDKLTGRFERVFGEMCDKIERLKRTRLKKMVAFEVRKHERRRKGVPRGVSKSLVRGDQKLLGRKREAESQEWVDC